MTVAFVRNIIDLGAPVRKLYLYRVTLTGPSNSYLEGQGSDLEDDSDSTGPSNSDLEASGSDLGDNSDSSQTEDEE